MAVVTTVHSQTIQVMDQASSDQESIQATPPRPDTYVQCLRPAPNALLPARPLGQTAESTSGKCVGRMSYSYRVSIALDSHKPV